MTYTTVEETIRDYGRPRPELLPLPSSCEDEVWLGKLKRFRELEPSQQGCFLTRLRGKFQKNEKEDISLVVSYEEWEARQEEMRQEAQRQIFGGKGLVNL